MARLLPALWLFGTGEAVLLRAGLGVSPWTVLAEGTATRIPLSVGAVTILVSVLVFAGWIPLRERPGFGTVANILVIGVAIDVMLPLLPAPEPFAWALAQTVLGVVMVGVGGAIYLSAQLGPGPRDGLMTGIHRRTGWPLWRVRCGIEGSALVVGWLLGGTVGIGTVLFALLVGPVLGATLRLLPARRGAPTPPPEVARIPPPPP